MVLDDRMAQAAVIRLNHEENVARNRHRAERLAYERVCQNRDALFQNMRALHLMSQQLPEWIARVEAQFRDLHYNRWGFVHSPNVLFPGTDWMEASPHHSFMQMKNIGGS